MAEEQTGQLHAATEAELAEQLPCHASLGPAASLLPGQIWVLIGLEGSAHGKIDWPSDSQKGSFACNVAALGICIGPALRETKHNEASR